MPLKRKTPPNEPAAPTISNREDAEAAIRDFIERFDIDAKQFQNDSDSGLSDSEGSTGASFSRVTYEAVAPLVGLEPFSGLRDIGTFEIHRSRIPTGLFQSIVMDLDVMLVQYGPPTDHNNEEARSRFFSPVFNHLVKQFTFMLRNDPETRRIGTRGRIEYFFKTFGAVGVLCIEMELMVGNDARLGCIAQVIAECDGCDLNNIHHGFSLPILCILSDGLTFEFFKFERTPTPRFLRGCFAGDPAHLRRGMELADFARKSTSLPFILELRGICETIFDTMVCAYIYSLRDGVSKARGENERSNRPSFDRWDEALKSAEDALRLFREAESLRGAGDSAFADTMAEAALCALHESTASIPAMYTSKLIMSDWDLDQVSKA